MGFQYENLISKAEILVEALPYIRFFAGETIVIKYGGAAMVDENLKSCFAQDITLLKHIGINPVIVHGGGPQIGKTLQRMNIDSNFIEGMRVTDDETINVVEMVLVGKVNKEIVARINRAGGKAVGLSGKDGALLLAEKMRVERYSPEARRPEIIDIGMVGRVARVDVDLIDHLESRGYITVIAPVGYGANGETYNINADFVAEAVASALRAKKLLLLTDTPGIYDEKKNLIPTLTIEETNDLIERGVIAGGMRPKARACVNALKNGVGATHIIDGRIKRSVLLEIFTDEGVGTKIDAGKTI